MLYSPHGFLCVKKLLEADVGQLRPISKMTKETRKKPVNGCKGHRTYVSKTLNSAENILKEYDKSQEKKLLSCKDILVEKLDTLHDLDDKIAELTDDEKALE